MSGINLVGEQIKPLKVLVHKEIKTLWEDIVRAKSNGQTINRESLLKSVEFMISDQLIAHEIWNKEWEEINDDGEPVLDSNGNPTLISHWNTWTDDKLFSNLLQNEFRGWCIIRYGNRITRKNCQTNPKFEVSQH